MDRDTKLLLGIFIGSFLLLGGTVVALKLTRGVRNNNPGNIEKGIKWKGLAAAQPDPRFLTFAHPKWGFRAIARILLGDFREGQNTVRSLIEEWSPQADPTNKAGSTEAYVRAVAKHLNVGPDQPISVPDKLPGLLDAIARHENAGYRYDPAIIAEGIALERLA
ncbi:MAG: structural protein [Hyphomonadaceae bacterium]